MNRTNARISEYTSQTRSGSGRTTLLGTSLSIVCLFALTGFFGNLFCSVASAGQPSAASHQGALSWVLFPGGTFEMGSNEGRQNEQPVHRVSLSSFAISRSEVTVAQYRACVEAGVCTEPTAHFSRCNWNQPDRDKHPMNCVDYVQALTYAHWVGGRLPTEAEWEYAARSGGHDQEFPWGDDSPSCDIAVMADASGYGCGTNGTSEVCSREAGNTEQGLCDMAGNVAEWVGDFYSAGYYDFGQERDPEGPSFGEYRVVRGGSWYPGTDQMRTSFRNGDRQTGARHDVGFRVARSAGWEAVASASKH